MPDAERFRGLLDQHAEPVEHIGATRGARPGEEIHRGAAVVQVVGKRARHRERERQLQRLAGMSGRRAVHDQLEDARVAERLPVARVHARGIADAVGERVGARGRAIGEHDFRHAGLQQRVDHALHGAAGTEHERATTADVDALAFRDVGDQPDAVRVVAAPAAAGQARERVDHAAAARRVAELARELRRDRLERQRDVRARAAGLRERLERRGERVRPRFDRLVGQRDAALLAEPRVDPGRLRMRDRRAEYGMPRGRDRHGLRGKRLFLGLEHGGCPRAARDRNCTPVAQPCSLSHLAASTA